MQRASFFGLEIGRTGLTTAQFGLDVTGHNISNLDTEGYTRQRIVSTAYDPFSTIGRFAPISNATVGGGVRVQILDQIRSAYLDRRFRDESNMHAYYETRSQSLTYIQSFFDNVNEKTSINHSLSEFFKAMKIIAEDPVAGAPRTLMQTAGMDLVQQLNMIYDGLLDFQKIENRAVETKVDDINRITKNIAELNVAIYTFELTGIIANDLRDKRNLLMDQLSEFIDIEYNEYMDPYGHSMLEIRTAGGTLVDHDWPAFPTPPVDVLGVREVPNVLEGEDPVWEVYWINSDEELDFNLIKGGQLKAHINMRDGLGGTVDSRDKGIPYYLEMINDLARALLQEVNEVHTQGWSDNPEGSETGIHFFAIVIGQDADGNDIIANIEDPGDLHLVTARNITLSQMIRDSAYNIAASDKEIGRAGEADPIELQRANNKNMLELYKIFEKTTITVDGRQIGSLDEYATTIRFDVGKTLYTTNQSKETSRVLTLASLNQKTAIAGVSLDEEMVGLVRYNHAYNGAARVITAMDDALDRLINGTGRVGL